MPPSSSQSQVLQIPELVESILVHVDLPTLLVSAQRTCRTWNRIIRESPSIQRALFFKPAQPTETIKNPLLENRFKAIFASPDVQMQPFSKFDMFTADKLTIYLRPEATWRRMLVTQPAVMRLGFWQMFFAENDRSIFFEVLTGPDGLRMGPLFDLLIFHGTLWPIGVARVALWRADNDDGTWSGFKPPISDLAVNCDAMLVWAGEDGTDSDEEEYEKAAEWGQRVRTMCRELGITPDPLPDQPRLNYWAD